MNRIFQAQQLKTLVFLAPNAVGSELLDASPDAVDPELLDHARVEGKHRGFIYACSCTLVYWVVETLVKYTAGSTFSLGGGKVIRPGIAPSK